jgi:MMPL family protein
VKIRGYRVVRAFVAKAYAYLIVGLVASSASTSSSSNPMVARNGAAVRFALVYNTDPLNATAVGQVRTLTARLTALGAAAGLRGVRYEVGGLAASFGLLAVIPLEQFRQMAIIMAVGVILDTVVVRSLLVPSLVALTGRAGIRHTGF